MKKKLKRKIWRLVDPISHALLGAAITDSKLLDGLRLRELSAIESFRTGHATKDDWMAMADMLNIEETLSRDGVGPEAMECCLRAQEALGAAHARYESTGRLGITGPELQAMRDAYAYHDLQRTSISRARYEQAIRKTADRIRSAHPSVKVCIE